MSQRKKRTPAPPAEEAGVTQGADVHHPQGEGASDPFQSEAFQIGRIIHGVTDIPEVRAYALRIGARLRSMRKLAVEEKRGEYGNHTLAVIKFKPTPEGGCAIEADNEDYAPRAEEREAINTAWVRYEWPKYEPRRHVAAHLPRNDPQVPWSFCDPANIAVCRDASGETILCVEERRPREDGRKDILIWTHWNDGVWRVAEPPDSLPLYGLERIKGASTIFLHEGPKAAKAVQRLIEDDSETGWRSHPWGAGLRGVMPGAVAHLAWMGGAERPSSTDYRPLTTSGADIVVVADNDPQGKDATGPISKATKVRMKALFFSNEWPIGFDLADPFPADMFRKRGDRAVYVGPRMADCLRPATWATDKISVGRGRPSYRPRREFVAEWTRSNTPLLYFHRDRPSRGYTEAEFNKMIRAYSHAEDTARLLDQRPSATADGITYAPGKKQGVITENGRQVIQTWQPAAIEPCARSAMPWLRFTTYLLPIKEERFQALRWTATLIARPDIRMKWGIIARSETQGVGKSTWADILAAQVGFDNVSMPSEQTIAEGKFNSFLARVRLVICNEFYSGHSFRTYNKMKTWITDHTVEVEIKYLPSHTVPAFAHFFLCSNELVPILIDQKDRRFFIPTLTERKLGRAYWRKFYEWLSMDGHGIIRRWAEQFVAKHGPVAIEEEAPPSAAKTAMIEKGQSDEMRLIRDLAEHWVELSRADPPERVLFALDDFRTWLWRQDCGGRKRLSGTAVQKAMRNAGLHVWGREDGGGDRRVKLDGRNGRKLIVITNFVPGPNEDWPTLGKVRLTDFDRAM